MKMDQSTKAVWMNGTKKLNGSWRYWWAGDFFIIFLDGCDPETGLERQPFKVYGDHPEWGKWTIKE